MSALPHPHTGGFSVYGSFAVRSPDSDPWPAHDQQLDRIGEMLVGDMMVAARHAQQVGLA